MQMSSPSLKLLPAGRSSLIGCFKMVAADVRRRRFGQLSSGNPPPHQPPSDYGSASVGGYSLPAIRRWLGGVAIQTVRLLAGVACLLGALTQGHAAEASVP